MAEQQPLQEQQQNEQMFETCARLISNANRIAVFTGAGMSAESGIGTFRGGGGLWSGILGYAIMGYFGTPFGWRVTPGITWKAYISRFYTEIAQASPNSGHFALAELQKSVFHGDRLQIITQNVDGLHQRAGNLAEYVYEVHGTVARHRCIAQGHLYEPPQELLAETVEGLLPPYSSTAPTCSVQGCTSTIRPDAVLFGESLPEDQWSSSVRAVQRLSSNDVMIIIGTSAKVYPAAGLPQIASRNNVPLIEINLESTDFNQLGNYHFLQGSSGVILPRLVERVKQLRGIDSSPQVVTTVSDSGVIEDSPQPQQDEHVVMPRL